MAIAADLSGNTPLDLHSAFKVVDVTAPRNSFAITPSDSVRLASEIRQLYAAGAGTVRFINPGGQTGNLTIAAGEVVPLNAAFIQATGTTATGLEGRY